MIKIDILFEFRKGILFIRIKGVITKKTYKQYHEEIISMIKNNGIKNVVLNLKQVTKIDLKGINSLFYTLKIVNVNKGILMLTNINDNIKFFIEKNQLLRYVKIIDNELLSFEEITI